MEQLSREYIQGRNDFPEGLEVGRPDAGNLPVKVLQFGEGNFLRGFVDVMLDQLNSDGLFNGSIRVVQPLPDGLVDILNTQDGLYTLISRGIHQGETICEQRIVTSIRDGVNPYGEYDAYLENAKNPDLRFIVSNTTEAGIVYQEEDRLEDKPQNSFPGKITAFLYARYQEFGGAPEKGLVFIPCELIDNNGSALREIVLHLAGEWKLEEAFVQWVKEHNIFTNTLVDRIVTGYPRDETEMLEKELGYHDALFNTCEHFHFWVIEGPESLKEELPFHKTGLNVLFTDDATPYKKRKVRILNGAHTMSVPAAFLSGMDTVGEMMGDKDFIAYLNKGLYNEIIPVLGGLNKEDLYTFASAVFDRFSNPFIRHYLLSITLNSVSKFRARVLPSLQDYCRAKGEIPPLLTFSFAALIAFYRGEVKEDGTYAGIRGGEEYPIADDPQVLELFQKKWSVCDGSRDGVKELVEAVCAETALWGDDLNGIGGFSELAAAYLYSIIQGSIREEVERLGRE